MNGRPKITVVTPTYNGAELLEDCIRSVVEQGYPELEYIVVDGGSTDGTLDVLGRYDDRIAHWTSEPDGGQTEAINKGFRRATGDLVAWLNADDFLYPGALDAVAEAYLADPRAPFYFGNGYRVDRDGCQTAEYFPDGQVRFRRDALVFGLNFILQPATFVRRESLEVVGPLDETLHYGFDTDLWIRLSALGRPRPIQKHLAASREYGGTKTATGSFRRAEELRRIAERHADVPVTPGSLLYYLDTLHRLAGSRPDVFPRDYLTAIESFWSATAELLGRHGARPDGFPVADPTALAEVKPSRPKAGRTRVGIELRQVTRGASGGIVVVLAGTLKELFRLRPDIDFVVFCTVFNRELLAVEEPNVELVTLPLHGFFAELGRLAREYELDALIRSYPSIEHLDYPLMRQVFLLPDVQHAHHPEFFDAQSLHARRTAFRTALEGAGAIWTISDFARRTIEEQAAPDSDVFVARPSLPPEFLAARAQDASDEERARLPEGEFVFFPANLWPHKNHELLFEALRLLRSRGKPLELVLTGDPAGWDDLRARHQDLQVRHLGFVSAPLMRLLYERALALAFFSRYEGFGIPPLEAFAVGTPVVCSNTTSLPEVAGDAALMCDPTDVEAMAELLERVTGDDQLRAELVERGKQRLAAYTWTRAAEELVTHVEGMIERATPPPLGELPLVSIVTPSYNQGRFIQRTIESVLAQTYPNVEHILVDGASTDETVSILRSYGDRIRWISEPDSGQTEAINKGLRMVEGEIVGYLNSDDVLLPHAIETVVEHFRRHPECDLVYGDADYIDENDRVTGKYATAPYSFDRLMWDCCICQPAAYWRREVGAVVGPFDEELQYAMDYDYWIRVAMAGLTIESIPETIAQSRLHPDAKTLVARRAIYREILHACRLRAGYISRSYVDGLWHHLAYERRYHPARLLRLAPGLRRILVSLHWRWLNRHLYSRRQWVTGSVRLMRRLIVNRLRRYPRLFALLLRARARVRALRSRLPVLRGRRPQAALPAAAPRSRVSGYWTDNWVEEQLDVVLEGREHRRSVRIVGRPVTSMTVVVSVNGTSLGQFELDEHRQETVTVDLPPGAPERVSFAFSDHTVDPAGRRIAFLLQETNLFREEDLLGVG